MPYSPQSLHEGKEIILTLQLGITAIPTLVAIDQKMEKALQVVDSAAINSQSGP
jgi:hypothetical protein